MIEKQSQTQSGQHKGHRFLSRVCFCSLLVPTTLWAALAIYYSNLPGLLVRGMCSVLFFIIALSIAFWAKSFGYRLKTYGVVFGAVLIGWWLVPASNHRDWQQDAAVLPYADIAGNRGGLTTAFSFSLSLSHKKA